MEKRKKWDTFEKNFFLARKMDEFGVFFWSKTEMWDSLLKKCVVADCKLEKHKLPLIDHKLSKTVESGDSPDSLESVDSPDSRDSSDSVFATPAEWKLERYTLKLLWCYALKLGFGL